MANQAGPLPGGYALTTQLRKGLRYFFTERLLAGFSGGLNLRDAPTELKPSESPSCWNVTLDTRGGVVKRLGYAKWNASAVTNVIQDSYYSNLTGLLFWYSPTDGKLYSDPGTGVLTLRHTFTSGGNRVSIVDFAGSVYVAHGVDGLYSSTNGTTWTVVTASSGSVPIAQLLCVWQNKLWVAGDRNNKTRVYFSAAGDATKWAAADGGGSVDIREKDDDMIVAIAGGPGFDLVAQPGLFVFKTDSTYRIYDSTTGAYMTVDPMVGAASKNAVVGLFGELYVLSRRGIYSTQKLKALVPAAEQIHPLFDPSQLDDTTMGNWCAGYNGDRVYFSFTSNNSGELGSANNVALEYAPLYGWTVPGSNAMACYQARTGTQSEKLIGASPVNAGQLYELNKGGSDDGADIKSWFETRWFEVSSGHQARLNLMRMQGRGYNLTVTAWVDFQTVENTSFTTQMTVSTGIPGTPSAPVATASTTSGSQAIATYYYVISGINAVGESVASTEVVSTITTSTGSTNLSWASQEDATSYRIYRGTSAAGETGYFTTTTNSITDTGLALTTGTPTTADPNQSATGDTYTVLYPRSIGRAFKIRVDETSNLLGPNPELFPELGEESAGTHDESAEVGPQTGGWALYSIDAQFAPLGLS